MNNQPVNLFLQPRKETKFKILIHFNKKLIRSSCQEQYSICGKYNIFWG